MATIVHTDLRNRHYRTWIEFLHGAEEWPAAQIAEYQLVQLQAIVTFAYERTPGYRRIFDEAGVTPRTISSLDDFRPFPCIDKEQIRDHLESFSAKVRGRSYVTTGGSTGIPFGFYRDPIAFGRELASKAHQYYRVGWREGDRQIVFRGLPIKRRNQMQFYPRFNELRCSSYHLIPEKMEIFRRRALEYRPEWLRCYPSSGYLFAKFLQETRRSFPELKGILCASENLYEFQKQLLTEVFGARVFSHYGHYEMAVLAGFCEHEDTYHVLPQYGYAELVDRAGNLVTQPGQVGEIIGTSFIQRATPFIRYRTRDFAVLKGRGCPACGRPYQVWERIDGRLQEFIVTGTGRTIAMTAINMHDDIFDHIKQFQFYQDQQGKVVFRFIPKESCHESTLNDMRRRLLSKFGDDVQLAMEPVVSIPPTKRGKHRFLIQNLRLDFPYD